MNTQLLFLLLSTSAFAMSSEAAKPDSKEIEFLTDREYAKRIEGLIDEAQKSILVTMYEVALPAGADQHHPVRRLLDHLIARSKAGVHVRVVLDAGTPDKLAPRPSGHAALYLKAAGVDVHWDEDDRATHAKSLVIDEHWCVVGSTNWSASALHHNREEDLVIDDETLAKRMLSAFDTIWKKSHEVE